MPAPVFLQDDRIDRLADLLEQRALPFGGLGLEALDGLLTALALGPEPVDAAQWQAVAWGGRPPRWNDDDEARDVAALLEEHRELALRRVCHDGELPDYLAPLLWLPEDPDADHPDTLDAGRDWADGFLRGVALREAAWDAWLDEHAWIDELLSLIDRLASGEVLDDEDPTAPPAPLGWRERIDIIAALPGMLADLHHHRIAVLTPRVPLRRADTPERNAPCPCGSGRKFKKCCGA
jgi:uncharacterized protein